LPEIQRIVLARAVIAGWAKDDIASRRVPVCFAGQATNRDFARELHEPWCIGNV
jgi:hypothetical protein